MAEVDCLKAELKAIPTMQASIETLKGEKLLSCANCALQLLTVTGLHKLLMPML